ATQATPVALQSDSGLQTLPEGEQDTFRIALPENIDTFDPLFTQNAVNVLPFMMETLTRLSSYGEVEPLLAFSWDISEDGLIYTFNLQTGVFFSDGTPFNAEAVKYNLERFQTLNPPMVSRTVMENIREMEVIDDHQIRLHLHAPSNDLLMALSDVHLSILSPASIPSDTEAYNNISLLTPYGTGAYMLAEYNGTDRLVLHRNLNYWNFAPFNDIIIIQSIPDVLLRENMLLNNEMDLIVDLPPEDVNILAGYDTVVVQEGEPFRQVFIGINTTRPFMDNAPVRQALNYAVDQQVMVDNILQGRAVTSTSPVPQGFIGACQASPPYTQDLELAASLLDQVSTPRNMPLKLILPAGHIQQGEQIAEAAANNLRTLGFQVTVEALDWETYLAALKAPYEERDYDLYLFEWAGHVPHSNDTLQLLRSDSPLNASHYNNPDMDTWIRSAAGASQDEAEELYCSLSQFIWQDAPWIFLYQQADPVIYSTRFTNIETLPGQRFRAIYAEPTE
ncbi:MAG: ABC transporter substrate-binding protein, partial [Anaerolineaceae bacterium]|nr:ABC transporter substrate-binding protein [Anaerolineaceae bacterium]